MNDIRNDKAKTIENIVCDFFGLEIEEVFSKNLKRDLVLARHLTIFILHECEKLSIRYLANRYNHSVRSTNRICANIRSYIEYDKKFRNQYYYLLRYMKEKGE